MPTSDQAKQGRNQGQLLIEQLGSDLGNAVVQLADAAAYGRSRLAWHRKLFVNGMKKSAFQNLAPEIIGEFEADSWASMIMCIARLTDADDRQSVTIRMLPRLIREDDELQRRVTVSRTHGHPHCCTSALIAETARNVDLLVHTAVVSKIDALFAVAPSVRNKNIDDFMLVAEYVLSESDPALELPEDKQWMAGFYGKVREHSAALRTGVCETLVLLAVHGDALLQEQVGFKVEQRISALVRRLLTPFTSEKLRSQDRDLPGYAEAAPDVFLTRLEEDLRQSEGALRTLLKPTDPGLFEHPLRTGVLWALERLAWNPKHLMRVVVLLAKLSRTKIDDNWVNKPINSLAAIFRAWIPQTAAPLDDRIRALDALCDQFQEVRDRYWKNAFPERKHFTEAETTELIDRLVDADRPRAAFFAVRFDWNKVETSRLKRLLLTVATVDSEPAEHFKIHHYHLSRALDSLGGRPGVSPYEMVQLEFAFIDGLRHSEHGIPNLEQRIAESPDLFVQVLAMVFRRSDGSQDPTAGQADDPNRGEALGSAADAVLQQVRRIPGENARGQVDGDALMRWVTDARRLCKQHGRSETGDEQIGQWLSRASSEDDARWPCRPVCEVLETIASEDMARGFKIGVYNGRGVTTRGVYEGGGQERALAARYRGWAQAWRFKYPTVGRILDAISESYARDAAREDIEVRVRKRLEH